MSIKEKQLGVGVGVVSRAASQAPPLVSQVSLLLISSPMKNVPNGTILWKGKETNLIVLFYSCLFPSIAHTQSTLESAHLARPHILGMHLYACRGTGCGVRRLLRVLFCWYYRIFVEYQLFTKNCVLSMVLFSSLLL